MVSQLALRSLVSRFTRRFGPPAGRSTTYRFVSHRWHKLARAIDTLGWPIRLAVDAVRPWRSNATDLVAPRSILVVQLDHLGDAVLSTGLLAALRERHPQARIDVLAAPWNREVFELLPQVDRIHICRDYRLARSPGRWWPIELLRSAWRLRRVRYDWGIDVRGELPVVGLLWLAGIRRRIGWDAGGGGFLLTDSPTYRTARHEVASRAALVDCARWTGSPPARIRPVNVRPRLASTPEARAALAERFAQSGVGRREPLVVLHIGAGTASKRWPAEHWEELLGRLALEMGDVRAVLVGGREERELARRVTGGRVWPNALDWTGELSIAQLVALLECAELFVGADSGPAHMAAALGVPVVSLFAGTSDPRIWRPWGGAVEVLERRVACAPCHQLVCPLAENLCMRGIRPIDVIAAVERLRERGSLVPRETAMRGFTVLRAA